MTDAVTFGRGFVGAINTAINALEALQLYQDRMAVEPGLAAAAATQLGRADITATDFNNAANAIVQLMFTFNSGAPTQKSFLYKML